VSNKKDLSICAVFLKIPETKREFFMMKKKQEKQQNYEGEIPNTPMRFMYFISKPFAWYAIPTLLLVTISQLLSSSSAYVLKLLIDALTTAPNQLELLSRLKFWGAVHFTVLCLMYLGFRLSGFVGTRWLALSKAHSFQKLYDYLVLHSHSYFINRFAGALAQKVSHASDGADNLIEQIVWHYYTTILSIGATTILLFVTNIYFGFIFLGLIIFLLLLNTYLVKRRYPMNLAYSKSSSKLRGIGVDLLTNITAMKHFSRVEFEHQQLQLHVDDRTQKDLKRDRSQEWGLAINNSFVAIVLGIIVAGVYLGVAREVLSIGDVVLVLSLVVGASYHLIFIGNMLNGFTRTYGEIEEGLDEILVPYEITDAPDAKKLHVEKGKVEWNDVTFEYDENKVFDDFNLIIKAGERVGLVGSSGAGKTTFVSLLLRQHDIGGGAITIDGQNIAEVTQDSLRENIAVVPQEPMLFHRTIRENIAYGKPNATDEEIIAVAKKAQAHDFIDSLPQKYETMVGERGVKLSGGQKQRVAIARAMLKNAPILVLDEATSALDSESEVAIQKALHELMEGKTVVAIAHRLSTLREMDRILVLENGKVVEDGTHTKLAKAGGIYQRLWEHQAGGFLQD
jgi:ATP-binding cassette subfamily B protein